MPFPVQEPNPTTQDPSLVPVGNPAPAPSSPGAPPTLGSAPTTSSTPSPGQGVALTPAGVLPASARATGLRMLSSDPVSPLVGEFWYRVDTHAFCVQESGAVKRVTLT